jgi:hypothetical protein
MESKRCKKHMGVGAPSDLSGAGSSQPLAPNNAASPSATTLDPSISSTCQYTDTKGRRCNMLPVNDHSSLCPHHIRQAAKREQRQQEAAANELLDGIEDFSTADSINLFLGNLVKQLSRKRIARRDAVALAYVSQLLLNSLTALDRQYQAEQAAAPTEFYLRGLEASRELERSKEREAQLTAS